MGKGCQQLRLLLWKNWILKKRAPIATLFEIIIPVIMVLIMVGIRALVHKDHIDAGNYLENNLAAGLGGLFMGTQFACGNQCTDPRQVCGDLSSMTRQKFGYAPAGNPHAKAIALEIQQYLYTLSPSISVPCCSRGYFFNNSIVCTETPRDVVDLKSFIANELLMPFNSEDDMIAYTQDANYAKDTDHRPLLSAFVLQNADLTNQKWQYKLRVNWSHAPDTHMATNDLASTFKWSSWASYYANGVVTLKWVIDKYIFNATAGVQNVPSSINFVPFPMPDHLQDNFADYVGGVFSLFMLCSFLWPFSRLVRNIVMEKEERLKEGMKMMGLQNIWFWMSWAVTYLVMFIILVAGVILASMWSLYQYSNKFLVFFFYFLFVLSLIPLASLFSTFFSRAKASGTWSFFGLLVMFLPYFAVTGSGVSQGARNLSCLLSPLAFSLGNLQFLKFECAFVGVQFNNLNQTYEGFAIGSAYGFLVFDIFLYLFLAWYLDKVLPSEFGTHQRWYFLCQPSYWCSSKGKAVGGYMPLKDPLLGEGGADNEMNEGDMKGRIEPVSAELRDHAGISIRSLRKTFDTPDGEMVAVKSLNLEMYEGQTFVLLGHNGAGKTTTINMLTGMMDTTAGTAVVDGHDINTEMQDVRRVMGVCPQHNILWDILTVEEHLIFFARLKGVPHNEIGVAVSHAMQEVQLIPQRNQPSATLSGGQKRRLSLAIALIGNSKIVFLDEPTSGVDPFSRRAIWNLITHKKPGRVIVLTTHFMDEADQLGDRIAILHKGQLKCCGSSLFLKRIYGIGYTLTLTKTENCNDDKLAHIVKTHMSAAKRLSNVGSECFYQIPLEASASFPPLLQELDSKESGVAHYGLSVTTLEEVFLKVAREEEDAIDRAGAADKARRATIESRQRSASAMSLPGNDDDDRDAEELKEPLHKPGVAALDASEKHRSFCRDFWALFMKRFHITKRDKKALVFQFLLPVVFLAFGLGLLRIPPGFHFPERLMVPSEQYNNPDYVVYNNNTAANDFARMVHQPTECVMQPRPGKTLPELSDQILAARLETEQSRYGAYFFQDHSSYTIFTNISGLHAMPTFEALANTAMFRHYTKNADAEIATSIHPFDFTKQEQSTIDSINGIAASIVIAFGFSFIPASYAVFVVTEKEQNSKHLQRISGVGIWAYWLSNYLWDMLNFLIPAAIGAMIVYLFNNPNYTGANFPTLCLIFVLYGASVIPFTYLFSFLFSSHSTAQNVMIMIYLGAGNVLIMTSFALYMIPSTRDINDKVIRYLFRLFPNFCLGDSIFWMGIRTLPGLDLDRYDMRVTGWDLVFMAWEAVVYFLLTILVEFLISIPWVVGLFKSDPKLPLLQPEQAEDPDVTAERLRIANGQARNDVITLRGLRKTYPPNKVAVDNLWFSIPVGECFGFLGVNGAGKTTTLKILTGDVTPTQGSASLGGFDIATQPDQVRRLMGYCPQFDALHEHLTARETIEFYGRIRGIPEKRLNQMVSYLLERLTLSEYANKPAGTYSGGNKRKLSVAIALIGNPRVVFLDEPSTGMDPVSRRFMWDFISETMVERAVILTTHSMEECEALCQRIAILVLGQLKCLGTSQHLKHRYANELQLDISTADQSPEAARAFVHATFPHATELECYGGKLKYRVPSAGISLAQMFTAIERNKAEAHISEYSIGQTSLEQIFIAFAKQGEPAVPEPVLAPGNPHPHQPMLHGPRHPGYGAVPAHGIPIRGAGPAPRPERALDTPSPHRQL